MFLDPYIFTPPKPDALTRAVESYQRVACTRFINYLRDAENPNLLPLEVHAYQLEPTPKQLRAEVRALRHLTAIQRTLREIGGPLFDPASPIPPRERLRLVNLRLDAIEEALGGNDDTFEGETMGTAGFNSVSPSCSSDCRNHGDHVSSSSLSSPGDFELNVPRPGDDFYHPPEIEDLLGAVDYAQRVFAARAELLDKRRLTLAPEDFLLEIASLRDLTAIVRTLRRMSAYRLPEDESLPDAPPASSLGAPSTSSASFSSSEISNASPEISDLKSGTRPSASSSPASTLSNPSISSATSTRSDPPHSSNNSPSTGLIETLNGDRSLPPVPRVPEVRPINGPAMPPTSVQPNPSSHRSPPSHSSHSRNAPGPEPEYADDSPSRFASPNRSPQKSPLIPVLHDKAPPPDNSP